MKSASLRTLLILAVLLTAHLSLHFFSFLQVSDKYYDDGRGGMLMTTPDAYYYLNLTQDYLENKFSAENSLGPSLYPSTPPLLVVLTAKIIDLTGIDLSRLAFYLPAFLSALALIVVWKWARTLHEDKMFAFIACMATILSFAYFHRTTIGYFDTDFLNLTLVWGSLLCVGHIAWSRNWKIKFYNLSVLSVLFLLLFWWWRAVAIPVAAFCSLLYALSISASIEQTGRERTVKITMLILGILATIMLLFVPDNWVPSILSPVSKSLKDHLGLIMGQVNTPFFNMGETISELARPELTVSLVDISGSVVSFLACFVGFVYICFQNRSKQAILFLGAPTALFVILSYGGKRFLMFLAPAVALGCAGFYLLVKRFTQKTGWGSGYSNLVACVLIFLVLSPGAFRCLTYIPKTTFDKNERKLARAIDKVVPKDASVWNWWGPGYFFQYFGNRKTNIDGGSQDPYTSYVAAVPFASPDPQLSSNWIKFFSTHKNGLHEVNKYIQDYAASVQFLVNIFIAPESFESEVARVNLPDNKNWRQYFYPEKKVYLVLLSDMLVRGTWLSLGRTLPGSPSKLKTPFYHLNYSDCSVDFDRGEIYYKNKKMPYGMIFSVTPKSLSHSPGQDSDKVAIVVQDADQVIYMDREHFDCLVFKLLFVHPTHTPYFKKIVYNPFIGGIWRVD